jgi:predicted amidophosphoribosyltransferase
MAQNGFHNEHAELRAMIYRRDEEIERLRVKIRELEEKLKDRSICQDCEVKKYYEKARFQLSQLNYRYVRLRDSKGLNCLNCGKEVRIPKMCCRRCALEYTAKMQELKKQAKNTEKEPLINEKTEIIQDNSDKSKEVCPYCKSNLGFFMDEETKTRICSNCYHEVSKPKEDSEEWKLDPIKRLEF